MNPSTPITYVAMDTHKKQHHVAVLATETGEFLEFAIANTPKDITRMVKKIKRLSDAPIHICYEAGVCGFDLKRRLEALGTRCAVIAPSLIPVKPGDKIKNDRRDARKLLESFKADQLTKVYAPNLQQEAARELTRLRHTAMENLTRVRHQITKMLTRHGYTYQAGKNWTQKHLLWIKQLSIEDQMLNGVLENYLEEFNHATQRLASLDKQLEQLAQSKEYKEIVSHLRCFHGIDTLTALCIVTELFDLGRFASPRQLMAYLGLIPSDHSSGGKIIKGPITKTGNKRIRRYMIEAAWHYRHRFMPGKTLQQRRKDQPDWAIAIADKAGHRLTQRYRHLTYRGLMPCKANTAIARELTGFIWALFKEYQAQKDHPAA